MKSSFPLLALALMICSPSLFSASALPEGVQDLKIGDAAPEFSLPGIDGKTHALAEYKESPLLMIAFMSNHCPDSHAAEGRIKKLVEDYKGKGLTLVAINPNNPSSLR
ncbi:MAG: hypothetical protein RL693_1572, partial [Verrucomicrobiota bacterium]